MDHHAEITQECKCLRQNSVRFPPYNRGKEDTLAGRPVGIPSTVPGLYTTVVHEMPDPRINPTHSLSLFSHCTCCILLPINICDL